MIVPSETSEGEVAEKQRKKRDFQTVAKRVSYVNNTNEGTFQCGSSYENMSLCVTALVFSYCTSNLK